MASPPIDVVIIHEPDVSEWAERLQRGLERGGLQVAPVLGGKVDVATPDPALVAAPILII